jgi:pimeloyl-ACP methyl ester carboxylesterase
MSHGSDLSFTVVKEKTSRWVTVDGVRLHYHEAGDGDRTLLGIHGGGPGASGWANYARNIDRLAEHFRVLLLDLPGFGHSDNPPADGPVLAGFARWVRGFLDALGLDRVHLMGNSLGGGISMHVAATSPERVDRMVLVGPAGSYQLFTRNPAGLYTNYYDDPSREQLLRWMRSMVSDEAELTEDLVSERHEVSLLPEIVKAPRMLPWVALAGQEMWGMLPGVQAPTLLTWGRDDRAIGLDAGIFLLAQLPHAELHVFSHCGHWAQWEKADTFNTLAIDFLSSGRVP